MELPSSSSSQLPGIVPKPFLTKLYKMVNEETHSIGWTPAGDALVVKDPEAFAQQLLPLHFKHNNFSSFVRQLNTYGFSKVDPDAWIFAHGHFRRGSYDELNYIQRKSSHRAAGAKTFDGASSSGGPGDMVLMLPPLGGGHNEGHDTLVGQEDAMRAELQSIQQCHTNMTSRIKELSAQLEATRAQQAHTRISVGKIMNFLSQVYDARTQNLLAPGALQPLTLPAPGEGNSTNISELSSTMMVMSAHPNTSDAHVPAGSSFAGPSSFSDSSLSSLPEIVEAPGGTPSFKRARIQEEHERVFQLPAHARLL